MRRILTVAVATVLCAGVAMAGGTGGKSCPKKPTITGEVTAINAATGKITIKGAKDAVSEWTVPATAKIQKPGKKGATLADLVVGDTVTICYEEANNVKTVNTVKVKPQRKGRSGSKSQAPAPK